MNDGTPAEVISDGSSLRLATQFNTIVHDLLGKVFLLLIGSIIKYSVKTLA
jgi:hypothetical protein